MFFFSKQNECEGVLQQFSRFVSLQIKPLANDCHHLMVVIIPLVSLATDQVISWTHCGIKAAFFGHDETIGKNELP